MLTILGFAVAAAGWRAVSQARVRLVAARATFNNAVHQPAALRTAEGRATTIDQLSGAMEQVATAHDILTASFALKVARFVPFAAQQRSGLLRLVDDSTTALTTGRALLSQTNDLAAQAKLVGARIPLDALATFQADVRAAGSTLTPLDRPAGGLIGSLGQARRDFDTLARSTSTRLLNDADDLEAAQSLLGAAGARNYFIAVENAAEERDQGAVLSFATATFNGGGVQVGEHGSLFSPVQLTGQAPTSLVLSAPAALAVPAGTAAIFGGIAPTQQWASVNATADFSFSGQAMQAMYRQATGQTVDGVIGLDVPAIAALLNVVGPITVPGVAEPITAANASVVLMHDFYATFPLAENQLRHEVLSQVVDQVVRRLSAGSIDPVPLAAGLATAAAGGHIQVWSSTPAVEALLQRNGLSGSPAAIAPNRTFHVAVENRNATKMDYYIKPQVEQQVTVDQRGTATIETTVTVHNTAPVNAPPSAQLGPDGHGTTQPGEYWAWVLVWGPNGSYQPGSVAESGLRLSPTILDRIYAGQSKQFTVQTVIPHAVAPDGTLDLRYVPQPRLSPPTLSVTLHADGWRVAGAPTWSGSWDKAMTLTWTLRH
jgi:hypothetical protein